MYWIVSLVVQNFFKNYPILVKTRKYWLVIRQISTPLILFFLKSLRYFYVLNRYRLKDITVFNFLIKTYFLTPFWTSLRGLVFKNFGPCTHKLPISLIRLNISHLNKYVTTPYLWRGKNFLTRLGSFNKLYTSSIDVLHIPNTLLVYNQVAYYLFRLFIVPYTPNLKFFRAFYTFWLLQPEIYLFIFQIKFFFKIRHY